MLDFLNLIIGRHIDIKQSLDYYKTVNSKYTRRVFTEMIYKENGTEVCKLIFQD